MNASIEKPQAIVETAHHYSLKDVRHPEFLKQEIAISEQVASVLEEEGYANSKIVLIDETRPETMATDSIDSWRWRLFIERDKQNFKNSLPADYKVWEESQYEPQAEQLITLIQTLVESGVGENLNARLAGDKQNQLKIGSNKKGQNISLRQKIITRQHDKHTNTAKEFERFIPSCPILDTCIYQDKLKQSSLAVTILPEHFKHQQEEVKTLFAILNQQPNIVVVYFEPSTMQVTEVDAWRENSQIIAQKLLQELTS